MPFTSNPLGPVFNPTQYLSRILKGLSLFCQIIGFMKVRNECCCVVSPVVSIIPPKTSKPNEGLPNEGTSVGFLGEGEWGRESDAMMILLDV